MEGHPDPSTPDVPADRQRQIGWRELPGHFPVTFGIGALTLAFFGLEAWFGGTMDHEAQMRLGALRPDRVRTEFELFRLFMPMLLHHGPLHLLMNGLAYVQLMLLTEHLFGSARALVFYVLSGLGAALATTWLGPDWMGGSVGASGAIMGLAGLLLGTSWFAREPWRTHLRLLFGRRLLAGVLLTFAVGVGLTFFVPIVDNWGHAGGFATGLLLALAHRDPRRREGRGVYASAVLLAAAWLGAIGWTALQGERVLPGLAHDQAVMLAQRAAMHGDGARAGFYLAEMVRAHHRAGTPEEGRRLLHERLLAARDPVTVAVVATQLYEEPIRYEAEIELVLERWVQLAPDEPVALNALAWNLVTCAVDRRDAPRAEALARRALALLGTPGDRSGRQQRAAFLDTHAEALLQLGRWSEAATAQREAVGLAEEVGLSELPAMRERLRRIEAALAEG